MPWNATTSGVVTTITQSGNDPDLSGLRNITGVTVTLAEDFTGGNVNPEGDTRFNYYGIGAGAGQRFILDITGTLNHDPEVEILELRNTNTILRISTGGTYNYGRDITPTAPPNVQDTSVGAPVGNRFSAACGLILGDTDTNSSVTNLTLAPFLLQTGGTFNWNGGEITCGGSFYLRTGATATIRNATLRLNAVGIGRFENAATLDVIGLRKVGGFLYLRNGVPINFEGYNPEHSNNDPGADRNPYAMLFYGVNQFGTAPLAPAIPVTDMTGTGNVVEAAILDNGYGIMVNPASGIGLRTSAWLGQSTRSDGRIEQRKDVQFNAVDLSDNTTPSGVNYHMRDVNTPGRPPAEARRSRPSQTPTGSPIGNNGLDDQVLVGVSNAQGIATAQPIYRLSTFNNFDPNRDLRCNTDGTMPFAVFSYLYNTQTPAVNMNGTGTEEVLVGLSRDANVTQQTEATVAGYNNRITVDLPTATITIATGETANLDEVYDYFKYIVTRPGTAGLQQLAPIEYTTRTTNPLGITNNGGVMQLNGFSLVLNGGLTNGTTFSSLDIDSESITGTGGSLSNLTLTNVADTQMFNNLTNVTLTSAANGTYTVNGDISGGQLNGTYVLGASSSTAGGLILNGATTFNAPYTLTDVMFGANFTVASGTGNITQGLDTDFQMMVGSVTARSLIDGAGFTTIVPPVSYELLLTLPTGSAGNIIVRNITDSTTANTATVANGAVTWATADNINSDGNATYSSTDNDDYRVYVKLTTTFGNAPSVYRTSITSFSELSANLSVSVAAQNPFFFNQTGGFVVGSENAVVQSFTAGEEFIEFRYDTLTAAATANGTQASAATSANTLDYLQFLADNHYEVDPIDYGQFSVVLNNSVTGISGLTNVQGIILTSEVQGNQTVLSNVTGFNTQQVGTRTAFTQGTGVAQVIGQDANEASIGTVAAAVAVALSNSDIDARTLFLVGNRLGNKGTAPYTGN